VKKQRRKIIKPNPMKILITFLFITLFFDIGYTQNTAIPDVNFEKALIDLGYDIGSPDGLVPTSKIDTLTYLNISGKNISDLSGIQDFRDLKGLNCSNNNITDIKITNNVALTVLNCSNNNIVDLNLNQNKVLVELFCNNNALTDLDLSNNVANLGVVIASSNQLSSFNLKNGNNLHIYRLDARNNPNLTCIQVDDAAYSNALWTFIDAQTTFNENCSTNSANAYIPDDNFEKRLIDLGYDSGNLDDYVPIANINTITKLDISGIDIADLTGIEYFEVLSELDCSDNNLTTLNLSKNTALSILLCKFNMITSLDLTQNFVLKELSCSNNDLTNLNVKIGNNYIDITFFDAKNNPNLTCIEVDDESYSTVNWLNIDSQSTFSENCGALAIDEYLNANIIVYPNPTTSLVSVDHEQFIDLESIKIFDMLGRQLQQTKNNDVDLSNFKSGIYFIKINTDKGTLSKKIIKI